ncbi:MAG TPA: alanine racemase [Ktedonobacterales bacterium]|nr:alanine racemase [Ktedonobacterales bacterium]
MIPLELLLEATHGEALTLGARTTYNGFAHDSRQVEPGDVFVAVHGLHGDGHDFVEAAAEQGAAAALIAHGRRTAMEERQPGVFERLERAGLTVIAVDDTRAALQAYASCALQRWTPTVIAVTGGVGKTTTKEALADTLGLLAPTFRSWRNYNDLLGLPLSLGKLEPRHHFAVVELGADHPGEIADLCALVRPHAGIVTNLAPTHLQYFDDLSRLRAELALLPVALPADGALALDASDPASADIARMTRATVAPFGLWDDCASSGLRPLLRYRRAPLATTAEGPGRLCLQPLDEAGAARGDPVIFPHLIGAHWAGVALAALTMAVALGADEGAALAALRDLTPLPGRMRQFAGLGDMTLLDDSHNATPASVSAGLATLAACGAALGVPTVAALGDMLGLGLAAEDAHDDAGRLAAERADYLVTRGPLAERAAEAAIAAGMAPGHIARTLTAEDTAAAIRGLTGGAPALVYIKGSEELRMEQVTALLMAQPELASTALDRQSEAWRRVVVMRPERPTWLEIDLGAIARNTQRVRQIAGPATKVLVSLKADAYGHGALPVARVALRNGAEWLGVATVSEARPLRDAGVSAPILVFGYTPPWQAREAARLDLRATVFDLDSARALAQAAREQGRVARVHVKVDTGMARLGLRTEDIAAIVAFARELRAIPGLELEGVFTHFATADSLDQSYARRQLQRFQTTLAALAADGPLPPIIHAANSAALLTLPEARFTMARAGVAIYGLPPSDEVGLPEGFTPALSFRTVVAQVKWIPAGEGISYGATYVTEAPTRVATLPVGYADGFRRAPRNWGEVLIRGRRASLLGRVAMDQCMVDVTHIPGVEQGDEVTLIGRQGDDELTAQAVAERLGTSVYEVVSSLLARVPRLS